MPEDDSTGEPWKTQSVVRQIMNQDYALTPGGEPGNDDLGAMSSWYVWAALGVYPQTPGVPMLVLGTPQFPRAVIHGAYGPLTITANGAGQNSAGDTYVQGLTVNGKPSGLTWVDMTRAHDLNFTLAATPDENWGSASSEAPPSFSSGPVKFPPSTRGALDISPGQVRLSSRSPRTAARSTPPTAGRTPCRSSRRRRTR
jgi:putative alpha-1,2-mannosidase